jgi:polysaccharide export outer membrane protein
VAAATAVACGLLVTGCPGSPSAAAAQARKDPVRPPEADTLGTGDVLEVKIFGEPDLSGSHKVRSDGTIALPLVGKLQVKGLNPEQVADSVRAAYRNGFLNDPEVTVLVTAYNSKRFYVLGAVGHPGAFVYEEDLDILRAVMMAGGFVGGAAKNSVRITRKIHGADVRMEIPVDDIEQNKDKNVLIMPGDLIYVPTAVF